MVHDDLHFMPPTTSFLFDDSRHQERMDRRYRYQRHVFDLSRGSSCSAATGRSRR
jgi:hypothetical protein